jgi:hypothetical protein
LLWRCCTLDSSSTVALADICDGGASNPVSLKLAAAS